MLTYLRVQALHRSVRNLELDNRDTQAEEDGDFLIAGLILGAVIWPMMIGMAARSWKAGLVSTVPALGIIALWGWPMYLVAGVPVAILTAAVIIARA